MSCWHRTRNLWPSGWAPKLNSRHSCHCGFHTSSVRTSCTSAFCVAKKKELELGPSQNTPTLCQCAIQHVWPHAGWTTEFIAFSKSLREKQSGRCLMHDDKVVLACQVLCEDRNIFARFDRTLQMADDYITASRSEASCLCILRGWVWIINFFHWSGSEVIIMQVWDQPCAASLLTKKVYLLSRAWQTLKMYYLLLPLLQLSHLLLDYKKTKPILSIQPLINKSS